ncbi:MAG: transporter substrate-binding domain-containing protein [Azonexus sp.]
MRKALNYLKLFCLLLMACGSLAFSPAIFADAPEAAPARLLRVVSDDNYPPYLFRNSEGQVEGYLVDLWQLWGKRNGIKVELTATNWADAQRMIQSGRADVIDMIFRTPPRELLYDFSRPYTDLPVAIYSHSSISGISGVSTLKGFQVGVQAGDACIDRLAEKGITTLQQYPNYAELIGAAQRHEIQVFCLDEYPANFYLYRAKAQGDFRRAFEFYRGQFHRAVRKGEVDTLRLVEQGMQAISADEEAALRKKWFGSPLDLAIYGRYFGLSALALLLFGALLLLWNLTLRRQVASKTNSLNDTLRELQSAHQATSEAKENLAATLQAIPDLLFELDISGRYLNVFANQENLLAAPKSNLVGQLLTDVLPPEAAATALAAIAGAAASGSDYGRTISLPIDGKERWFELSATRKRAVSDAAPHILVLSRDITLRRETEQALVEAREARLSAERDQHFRAMFTAAPVALSYVRGDTIEAVNQCFVELFGYQTEDISSLDAWWLRAYPDPAYRQSVQHTWQQALARAAEHGGKVESLEYRVTCKDGIELKMLIGGQLLDAGLVCTFVDITAQKAAEAALMEARDAADAANAAKSAFLANMSHEIRTPMNAILGYAHLLKRSALAPDQAARLDKIEEAGEHLLAIINDILDISKIESGKLLLEYTPFHPATIIDQVHSLIADAAAAKGLQITTEYSGLPPLLLGDPTRLRQGLLNFAGNAVKFTEQGSIALRAQLLEQQDDSFLVRFEVQDTGVGIPAESCRELFQAFKQVDSSTTRKYGGTGLGLAITQRLAQLMGGEVGVTSAPGVGSTFWFTVRLKIGSMARPTLDGQPLSGAADLRRRHAGARLLLVEDDLVNQELARDLLAEAGLQIEVASNGREAVAMAAEAAYDAILMDMQMPEMGGLEATRAIRQLPGHSSTPIIAMTANAFEEDREKCLRAGMDDFLAKPAEPEILYQKLQRWLVE